MSSTMSLTKVGSNVRRTSSVRTDATDARNRLRIVLGDDKYEIVVPKALICSKSLYFQKACHEQDNVIPRTSSLIRRAEGEGLQPAPPQVYRITSYKGDSKGCHGSTTVANTIRLKQFDPKIFSIFLAWAVTGSLEEAAHLVTDTSDSKERAFGKTLQLLECYILAEKIGAEDFKNHAIDHIVSNEKSLLYDHKAGSLVGHTVEHVYSNTPLGSPLRRFIVDVTINTIPKDLTTLIPDKDPNVEYVRDCFRGYQDALTISLEKLESPWQKNPCDYHDHSDRPQGYKCRK